MGGESPGKQDDKHGVPPRLERPSLLTWLAWVIALGLFVSAFASSGFSPGTFSGGFANLLDFFARALPPETERLPAVGAATVETFQMALIGTALGSLLSLPLALLAARNFSPHPVVYYVTRTFIAFLRAIPDLVWALVFIVAVGLGPPAGILALTVDAMGFCGRFFSERIEELDPKPIESLRLTGASPLAVVFGSVVPAAFPSFVATTLFALESATRSAVVLGLVGAGGIGVELTTSMELMRYDEALTIIIVIFLVVVAVERTSAAIRRRII